MVKYRGFLPKLSSEVENAPEYHLPMHTTIINILYGTENIMSELLTVRANYVEWRVFNTNGSNLPGRKYTRSWHPSNDWRCFFLAMYILMASFSKDMHTFALQHCMQGSALHYLTTAIKLCYTVIKNNFYVNCFN